ncbi:MAG: mycofactocin biosynthesis glycosyltransferase MftF [Aeromicrobium sp.]
MSGLPEGFRVRLGHGVRRRDGGATLVGGMPARLLYLRPTAQAVLGDEGSFTVVDRRTGELADLLLARGVADPVVQAEGGIARLFDTTIVIPVKDRPESLERLLGSLPREVAVIVVDDGSVKPTAVGSVTRRHHARLIRSAISGGPAAARNRGLREVRTTYVAFVDSDVVADGDWLETLLAHFDDPRVGLAAPRILGLADGGKSWIARYESERSSLDLGPRAAAVQPRGWVSYVPSACLVARVEALGSGFDESLQVAEDVDLIWRIGAEGWRVRYEPTAFVRHDHRVEFGAWLARKHFYGTGAALLAQRHGSLVSPVVVTPWSASIVVAVMAQRRWSLPVAAVVSLAVGARLSEKLTQSPRPKRTAAAMTGNGVAAALWQAARTLTRHWWPLAVVGSFFSKRIRRATLVAAVAEGVADYVEVRPELDPMRYVLARRLDDLAYGSGLWWGSLRARSLRALLPSGGKVRVRVDR